MGQITIAEATVSVDDADLPLVMTYQWHLHRLKNATYVRGYRKGVLRSGQRLVYLHRLLMDAADGQDVDHINGSGLDNRRANLRVCSRTQNSGNRKVSQSATGMKGVHFEAYTGRWRAEIQFQRKKFKLGRFETQAEAKAVYDAKARELYGEFAAT